MVLKYLLIRNTTIEGYMNIYILYNKGMLLQTIDSIIGSSYLPGLNSPLVVGCTIYYGMHLVLLVSANIVSQHSEIIKVQM